MLRAFSNAHKKQAPRETVAAQFHEVLLWDHIVTTYTNQRFLYTQTTLAQRKLASATMLGSKTDTSSVWGMGSTGDGSGLVGF